ncbi:hypothetical protein BGZ81_008246 [Podila clonocystis]|nr:hypothetical protein BGZ81_008246 [Podila clonocystis]
MHKSSLLLLAVYAASVSAYEVVVKNNAGWTQTFPAHADERWCYCMKNTQTNSIKNTNGGDVKLFSTTDCTGNYSQLKPSSQMNNAQWVNSFSMGASGIPSEIANHGSCLNWFEKPNYP